MSIESPKDVPEVWRPYFDRRAIEFTFRALERRVPGVSINTIVRALTGEGTPTRRVASKIGDALGVSPDDFLKVRAEITGPSAVEPFHLPPRASSLSATERRVVVSVVDAILAAREGATDADLSTAAAVPAQAENAEDQAREGQKTVDVRRAADGAVAEGIRITREAAEAAPPSRIVLSKTVVIGALQDHARRIRDKAPAQVGRESFQFVREHLGGYANGPDLAAAATEIENSVRWGEFTLDTLSAELLGPIMFETEAMTSDLQALSEILAEVKEASEDAAELERRMSDIPEPPPLDDAPAAGLAVASGKPNELRATQDPFDDPNPDGVEWPDGTVVTPEQAPGYLQWLTAGKPDAFGEYRDGRRNDYDLAAGSSDERKGPDDRGLGDGEE